MIVDQNLFPSVPVSEVVSDTDDADRWRRRWIGATGLSGTGLSGIWLRIDRVG